MFDSPFLSDGSQPLRGAVLSYFILSLILFSVFYFVAAFLFEIKASKAKRKTKLKAVVNTELKTGKEHERQS